MTATETIEPKKCFINAQGGKIYPLQKGTSDPYSNSIRAKLKNSCSDRRKISQQIIHLKRQKENGTITQEEINNKVLNLLQNPKASAQTIQSLIQDIANEKSLTTNQRFQLISICLKFHELLYGTKSINIQAHTGMETFYEQLKLWREAREQSHSSKDEGNTINIVSPAIKDLEQEGSVDLSSKNSAEPVLANSQSSISQIPSVNLEEEDDEEEEEETSSPSLYNINYKKIRIN